MSVSEDGDSPIAAVTGAVGLGLIGLVVGLVIGLISISVANQVVALGEASTLRTVISMVAQGIGLVLVSLFYLVGRDLPWSYLRVNRPSARDLAWAVIATFGLFATLGIALFVVQQLGLTPTEHSVSKTAEENPQVLLLLVPLSVIVTGPAEELLYRGIIQTRLREVFGMGSAIAVASTVFALVHIPAYALGSGFNIGLATVLGILLILGAFLGTVYEYTDNLVVPAVAHGLYNAVVFGSNYVDELGIFGSIVVG